MLKNILDKFLEIEMYEKAIIIFCSCFSMYILFLILKQGV